jgi:putative membrane protein
MATKGHSASWLRDLLANDRTLLAWLRTGVSLVVLGFVVAKFDLLTTGSGREIASRHATLSVVLGVVLAVSGAGVISLGLIQHRAVERYLIDAGEALPRSGIRQPAIVAAVLCLLMALAMAAFLIVSRHG